MSVLRATAAPAERLQYPHAWKSKFIQTLKAARIFTESKLKYTVSKIEVYISKWDVKKGYNDTFNKPVKNTKVDRAGKNKEMRITKHIAIRSELLSLVF